MQTTNHKGTTNEVQLPGKIIWIEERKRKRGWVIKKKSDIMKNAEKERRAFRVTNELFSLDFNRGW